jgi:4a-hydroxytetrahydrobiopterin dehydratase
MSNSSTELASRHCQPLKGAEHALSVGEIQSLHTTLPQWALSDDGRALSRDFTFENFHYTMACVNAIAWIAHQQDHHPDMEVGYDHCQVRFTTHDVGGLSINDFICAAKVEALAGGHRSEARPTSRPRIVSGANGT